MFKIKIYFKYFYEDVYFEKDIISEILLILTQMIT